MLPYEINGLPLHILLVHVVVIVVPAGAIMTALGAVWPAFRRKLGILTPIVTLIGLASVPLATNAGEWLADRVGSTPLLLQHIALGDTMLPWAVAQFLVATVIWAWYRFFAAVRTVPEVPLRRASTPVPVGANTRDPFEPAPGETGPIDAGGAAGRGSSTGAATAPSATAAQGRFRRASSRVSVVVSIVLIVVGVGVSAGTVIRVVQVGESGSNAVWQGSFSEQPTSN